MSSFQQQQHQQHQQQYANNIPTTTTTITSTSNSPDLSSAIILIPFDPETSPIPGQQAWVILDLYGTILRSSVENNNSNSTNSTNIPSIIKDVPILYNMLIESTALAFSGGKQQGLNRMTINFDSCGLRYVIARDENHIYLLQTKVVQ